MNNNRMNFRIKHYGSFNPKGKVTDEYYYIQEWKKFLWWPYWKDIKHRECGYAGCYKTRTTFKTLEQSKQFIKEILCTESPRDGNREKIIETITCKKDNIYFINKDE